MTDPNSASEERPTQPRDRFHRIISSGEGNAEKSSSQVEKSPSPNEITPPIPAEGEQKDEAEPGLESKAPPEIEVPAENQTPLVEGTGEQPPAETVPPSTPADSTSTQREGAGGWYTPVDGTQSRRADRTGRETTAPEKPASQEVDRHPTGDPEQTGGWYTPPDLDQTQANPVRPDPEQTQANPIHPDPDQTQANPVKPGQEQTQASRGGWTGRRRVVPPDQSRTIPPSVPLDRNGMPLPNRVDEVDRYATRVTPVAYGSTPYPPVSRQAGAAQPRPSQPLKAAKATPSGWRRGFGCLVRLVIALLFLGILALVLAGSFAVYQYYSIAASLPSVSDLKIRASQFETTRILDRNGNVLYEILDPNAGRRTYVPLEKISPYLIAATIATEDKDFYTHPGFDPLAIARALYQNYTTGEITSGASTITQQLARIVLLPNERFQTTIQRKSREIVLAAEITRRYSKEEILELYLNEIYYGNLAYGIEAASETYFNTTSDKLNMGQSAFLAGLPQAPGVYDIYNNRTETLNRQKSVLVLMYQDSQEQNCIYVSTNLQKVCVDANTAADAAVEMEAYNFQPPTGKMRYPHWVNYVRSILEAQYDPQTIYHSGFTVYTTLDPGLQDKAEQIVHDQVTALADRKVTDGALIALRPNTGEILAMVGSADFYNDAISGQVNMAISPRQPGSSIKPLTYTVAFEKGWTPATLIWDVPSEFPPSGDPNDHRPPYVPVNYDGRFRGPVTVRTALANSLNIPAVKTLNFVGVYDRPDTAGADGFVNFARRMGITTLTRNDYGLALTLGGGDVSLLELTAAYGTFANLGRRVPPVAITKIVDHSGALMFEYKTPPGEQVIRAEHAYLITSILSDNEARTPLFGANSVLKLAFPVAAKTGTTNDFRDNWTLGFTPDLAVGVWVGNADYTPMQNTTGLTGAAPIWAAFMTAAIQDLTGGNPTPFARPAGIVERVVCAISGTEPSQWCPDQRSEVFAADQLPLPKEKDLWQKVKIDTWSGLLAGPACPDFTDEKFAINTYGDPWAAKWIKESDQGREWAQKAGFEPPIYIAPDRACKPEDPHPKLAFVGLQEGQTITSSPLEISASIEGAGDLRNWRLEYGVGDDPVSWNSLVPNTSSPVNPPNKIYSWDLKDVPAGRVTLRLSMNSTEDTSIEKKIHLNIQVPTPTPTITPTVTTTPIPTITSTPAPTYTPTFAPPTPTLTSTP